VKYYNGTMKEQPPEEITATAAAERLNMTKRNVILMIHSEKLTARLVSEAPRPYFMVEVDDKFIAEEKARSQSAN
jgi:hypothetical protein